MHPRAAAAGMTSDLSIGVHDEFLAPVIMLRDRPFRDLIVLTEHGRVPPALATTLIGFSVPCATFLAS